MTVHDRTRGWRLLVACARHAAGLADAREVVVAAALIDDWRGMERQASAHDRVVSQIVRKGAWAKSTAGGGPVRGAACARDCGSMATCWSMATRWSNTCAAGAPEGPLTHRRSWGSVRGKTSVFGR